MDSAQGWYPWHSQISFLHRFHGASLVAQTVMNLPAMQDSWVRSLGWENPLKKGMATHSSALAWRIPRREEPGRLQSTELQRVGHNWATNTFTFIFTHTAYYIYTDPEGRWGANFPQEWFMDGVSHLESEQAKPSTSICASLHAPICLSCNAEQQPPRTDKPFVSFLKWVSRESQMASINEAGKEKSEGV